MTPEPAALPAPTSPLAALWAARSVAVVGRQRQARVRSAGSRSSSSSATGMPGASSRCARTVRPWPGLPSYPSLRDCRQEHGRSTSRWSWWRPTGCRPPCEDCAAAGVPVAIICTSGFAETGEAGAALQDEVVARARAGRGAAASGPNCIGSVGAATGQVSSFSPLFSGERPSSCPARSASSARAARSGYGAVSLAFERGLGLGWVVNTGNEADVTARRGHGRDLPRSPDCRGLLGYVETPRRLRPVLRAVAATGTPVALLKAGRSDAGASAPPPRTPAPWRPRTGWSTPPCASSASCASDDVEELLDLGDAFDQPRRPQGRRVAVVTTSGGSGILAADAIEAHGLELAAAGAGDPRGSTRSSPRSARPPTRST